MATKRPQAAQAIDPERLTEALHRLSHERLVDLTQAALAKLPPASAAAALRPFLDPAKLRPTKVRRSVTDDVREFDRAVRAGDYYEGFNVNSRNFMEKSEGTEDFIRDCLRLLDRAVAEVHKGPVAKIPAADLRRSFETIFAVLRRIDEGEDDVFFADEQGAFQVGVPWETVFPGWFACLASTAAPEDFARLVVEWVDAFEDHRRKTHFTAARRVASDEQKRALRQLLAHSPAPD